MAPQRRQRPRTLILDIYGAYVRQLGGWLAISDLVALMRTLGVDEQAVRSAVSRMSRRGLLQQERRNGFSGYRLTERGQRVMDDGDRRIYAPVKAASLDEGFALVLFSVPETNRDQRQVLRSRLSWLGFGSVGGGAWIAVRPRLPDLLETLRALDLEAFVDVFEARYRGFDELVNLVRRCWDLPAIRAQYGGFLRLARPVMRRWDGARPLADPRRAFVDYTNLLHRWRKLPFLDPGLPRELLPVGWEGQEAAATFFAIRRRLEAAALRYVRDLVRSVPAEKAHKRAPR